MRREGSFREHARRLLDGSVHAARSLAGRHDGALPAYMRLLWQGQTPTGLLHSTGRAGDLRTPPNAGLLALAPHHAPWVRPAEDRAPEGGDIWPPVTAPAPP